ncbi:MAG: hypothetical protein KatS3mg090_0393 [Patescibacteria group bacterium]|nr:MAG: hypothetical protein KatS3mg090_0393 [Patescibacteria group bacterium]
MARSKKIIVTHTWPDLDAIASAWLIKRHLPGWKLAEMQFVPAGETLNQQKVDSNPNIIHTDTGLGQFDHHQLKQKTSATERVLKHLIKHKYISGLEKQALIRLTKVVTFFDNFQEVNLKDPTSDIYDFLLHQIIEGVKIKLTNDLQTVEFGFLALEGVLNILKNKLRAEKELKNAYIFKTSKGKGLAVISSNEVVSQIALKSGYKLVLRFDKNRKIVKIKAHPESEIDLTETYNKLKNLEPKTRWFLHQSKKILLNGTLKSPNYTPTKLKLPELIEVLKQI